MTMVGWIDECPGWGGYPETDQCSRELPPEQVIAWLRTLDGEQWAESRLGAQLELHWGDSGVFADVIPDVRDVDRGLKSACWPDPRKHHALDGTGYWWR